MKEKVFHSLVKITGIGALTAFLLTLVVTANAQCFGSPDQWLAAAASVKSDSRLSRLKSTDSSPLTAGFMGDEGTIPSIAGLWHVHYLGPAFPGGDLEAYQIFNAGGTEVHNPNAPTDGVCLGAWVQASRSVQLTHRVWLYTPTGAFVGVGHLEANITLGDKGMTQTGTLIMQIFDLGGNAVTPPIPGTLSGERIVPN
jgi:hypothetical protein